MASVPATAAVTGSGSGGTGIDDGGEKGEARRWGGNGKEDTAVNLAEEEI